MKYIWVKDTSHEWLTTFAEYDNARNKATELGLTYSLKIMKQADSIEELCDFVVFEWQDERVPQFMPCDHISLKLGKEANSRYCIVYGAIYVKGKGLVFVSKMNEKGEFELI